jgi:hypothetical protein
VIASQSSLAFPPPPHSPSPPLIASADYYMQVYVAGEIIAERM